MKLEEISAQKQCHKNTFKKKNTPAWEGVQESSLESHNPSLMQTRGGSGPLKWLRRFHTAHLPVCRREPALRSVDSWRQHRLGFHEILLEHARHPFPPGSRWLGACSSLHADRGTDKPRCNHIGPHPTGTLTCVCVA